MLLQFWKSPCSVLCWSSAIVFPSFIQLYNWSAKISQRNENSEIHRFFMSSERRRLPIPSTAIYLIWNDDAIQNTKLQTNQRRTRWEKLIQVLIFSSFYHHYFLPSERAFDSSGFRLYGQSERLWCSRVRALKTSFRSPSKLMASIQRAERKRREFSNSQFRGENFKYNPFRLPLSVLNS